MITNEFLEWHSFVNIRDIRGLFFPSMTLPRAILDRVSRVRGYHHQSKHTGETTELLAEPDHHPRPNANRVFDGFDRVPLPPKLLDAPSPARWVLDNGLGAISEGSLNPPQDLRTLASWLYMAAGQRTRKAGANPSRNVPSLGNCFPCEIYVAAFAIAGLEPGLYHFCVRDFSLYRLRDGQETLSVLKRGRPDLEFIKNVPAALIVTTIFCRSSWLYRERGYRAAVIDAGAVVQNLVVAGIGLGIQATGRLQLHDANVRELIGIPSDADFSTAEAAHALVVWGDNAVTPMPFSPAPQEALYSIPREPLADEVTSYPSILAVHQDCVAPGVAMREVRPPLTDLSPASDEFQWKPSQEDDASMQVGTPLRQVLFSNRWTAGFTRESIHRAALHTISRLAFRGGTFHPLLPEGPQMALVRPIWVVQGVIGVDDGVWAYSPQREGWALIRRGSFRNETGYLALEHSFAAEASAVCWMLVNIRGLLGAAGPDLYRLAHLEAGIAGQRMLLAACAVNVAAAPISTFLDEDVRMFLGFNETGWEVVHGMCVGTGA